MLSLSTWQQYDITRFYTVRKHLPTLNTLNSALVRNMSFPGSVEIIIKSLDPLRAKKTFIRKKLGHTAVSAIKASSVSLQIWRKEPEKNTVYLQVLTKAVISKTDINRKMPKYYHRPNLFRK